MRRVEPSAAWSERQPVVGTARVDRRTKDLAKRLLPGEIAVIDHLDLDTVAAESLLAAGVAAVINASACLSGRYPNPGPLALITHGIPIIDDVGPAIMNDVVDGQRITVAEHLRTIDGAPRR